MSLPIFPSPNDAVFMASFGKELYAKCFRRCTVFPFRSSIRVQDDDIYGEDLQKLFPLDLSYETPCLIAQLPGWKAKLTKEGVDQERDLTVAFNRDLLIAGNHPFPTTGFHLVIQEERYKILSENISDYFANIDVTFTWTVLTTRWRPQSVSGVSAISDEDYP
jgi:hypothetical protein